MSENDSNKCPLCGKETQGEEIFCRDCQEIAQNSYAEDLLYHDNKDTATSGSDENASGEDTHQIENNDGIIPPSEGANRDTFYKRNKKILTFFFIGLIIFVIVGMSGAYMRMQNRNTEATEIAFWNKCIEDNSPLGYSKYLVQYPEGKFSEEAYRKIVELRDNERKSWEKLRNSNDIDALFAFLTDHPETPYGREIRHAIDSLSWVAAQKQNTADVYLAYLENAKIGRLNGEYATPAQERYDYLSQLKTLEGKQLDEVKKLVSAFFKALSSNNSKEIQKLSMDTLNKFYESKNYLSKNISDSLKTAYKAGRIKSVLYTPLTDSIDAILDNKGICFITLPLNKEVTYTDRKKKERSRPTLGIELYNKKLQAVYVKGKAGDR
ncbi:hypothetical protein D0T84_11810 [Dysgonomonas sp. 521]|uniref:hypothetical protein n=1 Tax=Dysgonomonas sp. 521 TaxID=2302932 RepID=UPI0013D65922|nr:hypothetical protein [Dysgonomonas sp. 521]NDV95591.1 hypothetical protein [Dysgonomonas sp. 521]